MDKRLRHAVAAGAEAWPWLPRAHRPVFIDIDMGFCLEELSVLVRPRPFPACRPIGPSRLPPAAGQELAAAVASLATQAEAGDAWTRLTAAAEAQMCALHDLVAKPAGPDASAAARRGLSRRGVACFTGRGRGFQVRKRQHAHHVNCEYGNIQEGEEGIMGKKV